MYVLFITQSASFCSIFPTNYKSILFKFQVYYSNQIMCQEISDDLPYFLIFQEIPPYNQFGSLEDSLQSCLSLIPQPPKKDFIKMLENDHKVLRFEAIMVCIWMKEII